MKFYRYEAAEYAVHDIDGELVAPVFPNPKLEVHEYEMKKETPKGYWIGSPWTNDYYKWISKSSRKRFAFPTKQEALTDYIRRTTYRIDILKRQLASCQMSLADAKNLQANDPEANK